MFSPFVKGLMSATLIRLGASSAVVLIQGFTYHRSMPLLPWYIAGFVALPLAFSLFTRSMIAARLAFGFLLLSGLVNIVVPIWTTIANIVPPTSKSASLFSGFLYLFPCVVAFGAANRRAPETSNQSLEPTAGPRDAHI